MLSFVCTRGTNADHMPMPEIITLNFDAATPEEARAYRVRNAVRAVLFDADGNIALMHVARFHFYKLPGGGIEGEEDKLEALKRECREEAGVDLDEIRELGSVTEIQKKTSFIHNSYCYTARAVGEKRASQFTGKELENGFEVMWVGLDEAIKLVESNDPTNEIGKYVRERELAILGAVRKISSTSN